MADFKRCGLGLRYGPRQDGDLLYQHPSRGDIECWTPSKDNAMIKSWRHSYLRRLGPISCRIGVLGRFGARLLPALTSHPSTTQTTLTRILHCGIPSQYYGTAWKPAVPLTRSHFVYQSLIGSSPIRLVVLEPGRGDDPIRCRLTHVSLDDNPKYEALSYAWGDPSTTVPMYLEDEIFTVTASLEAALSNLRDGSLENPRERVLWIDAVCINQFYVLEKNHQVRQMGNIYKHAVRVLIWIGHNHEPPAPWEIRTHEFLEDGTRDQNCEDLRIHEGDLLLGFSRR